MEIIESGVLAIRMRSTVFLRATVSAGGGQKNNKNNNYVILLKHNS